MKFARFEQNGVVSAGAVFEYGIKEIEGDILGQWDYTGRTFHISEIKLLAPIEPKQVIGIGANFVAQKEDLPETLPDIPVFFFKPTSSVIGPDEEIVIPSGIDEVKFESELAVIIGKEAKNLTEEEVEAHIFGYTVANDVTAPQFFRSDGHWMVGKSFDTFTPLGPVIETELDFSAVSIEARVNEAEKQNSGTDLMIILIPKMIAYLSKVMTLKPGDVILTGSPVGAEFVKAGDSIACEIKEIGILQNKFVKEKVETAVTE